MEPENHLFEKENHLPNLHFGGSMLIFQGCILLSYLNSATPIKGLVLWIGVSDSFGALSWQAALICTRGGRFSPSGMEGEMFFEAQTWWIWHDLTRDKCLLGSKYTVFSFSNKSKRLSWRGKIVNMFDSLISSCLRRGFLSISPYSSFGSNDTCRYHTQVTWHQLCSCLHSRYI